MKRILISTIFLYLISTNTKAQQSVATNNTFKTFTRAEINYILGFNDDVLNQRTNSLHVKLVVGAANANTGLGIGLENASYRAAGGSGASFETLNLSANVHFLAKPISVTTLNYFVKGSAGYAPKLFKGYNKGFNYEAASGVLYTSKRNSKYFLQAIYHYQEIEGFNFINGRPQIKGIGLGLGTWF